MRPLLAVGILLAAIQLTGCTSSAEPAQQTTPEGTTMSDELVPGYDGGCEDGFTIYVQNQFTPYGTVVRKDLSQKGQSVGLTGNEELTAVGWTTTEYVFYPDNPPEIQGKVWFYVPELPDGRGPGWVPDAGVRAVKTEPAPGDEDEYFEPATQAAPQSPECELLPR